MRHEHHEHTDTDCHTFVESSPTNSMMPLVGRCWNVPGHYHRMLTRHAENALALPRRKTKNPKHQH